MGLSRTAWALPGLLTGILAWTGAVVVLRTAPPRALNRRLAFLLFLEGLWLGSSHFLMVEDPGIVYPVGAPAVAAMAALPFQYPSFLSRSLRTPLVAPFRSRIAFVLRGLAAPHLGKPSSSIARKPRSHWPA